MTPSLGIGALVLALAGAALGQVNTFDFVVSNVVSPEQPSATVQLWASFDPAEYAFGKARFSLQASADQGGFSDPVLPLIGPGEYAGSIPLDGDSVNDVYAWQIHLANGGPYADESNPILIWSATWSTSKFTPRTIDLDTLTVEFYLYVNVDGTWGSFIDDFAEGAGSIQVVPAPGALAVTGLVAPRLLGRRRWR